MTTTTVHEIVIPGVVDASGVQLQTRSLRTPGGGEVLIAMEATGVSYAEVQMLRGRYPGQPAFPFVPGYDLVGRVVAIGAEVDGALLGKRVATLTETGAWSTHVLHPANRLAVVDDNLDPAAVDTLLVNGLTALKMLHRTAQVRAGQTIVVHGAGGGVGTMLVQLAVLAGIRVIGTCKPEQRAAVEALGADVVDYTAGNVVDAVRAFAVDGVDAVFDHVGGASIRHSYAMLREGGVVVSYGHASVKQTRSAWIPIFTTLWLAVQWRLRAGGRRLAMFDLWGRGSFGADRTFRPQRFWREFREDVALLVEHLATGHLVPQVARRLPLREAGAALALHNSGAFVGKIVLLGDVVAP